MKQTYSDFIRSIRKDYGASADATVSYEDEACSNCGAMIRGWHAGHRCKDCVKNAGSAPEGQAPLPVHGFKCKRERHPIKAWCLVCLWERDDDRANAAARRHTQTTGHETRYEITSIQQRGYEAREESESAPNGECP